MFKVVWDNGHASGALSGRYDTEEAAEAAGEDWLAEMLAIEPPEKRAEAEEAYSFDVVDARPSCPACGERMWTCDEVEDTKPCGKHWHCPECGHTQEKEAPCPSSP